jgi:hypothetical protein
MAQEIWRNVVGFEGLYIVSNLGNVMSLPRVVRFGPHSRLAEGRAVAQCKDAYGYSVVFLSNGAKRRKNGKVHRLVAEAFIPNPDNLETVDHINGIKGDNRVENLRWCSAVDNFRYACEKGLHGRMCKEAIEELARRTARPVIRDDGEVFSSVAEAARALGVTDNAVQAVLHGRNRTCRKHTFEYLEDGSSGSVDSREDSSDS